MAYNNLNNIEYEIMFMLFAGQSALGVMEALGLDYKDYVSYKRNIFKKLGIHRMTQIAAFVLKNGMI